MSGITAGALTLLAAITILNLVLTLAVIRRLRDLPAGGRGHDDHGTEVPDVLPPVGQAVGDLVPAGRHTAILITPSCPPCRELLAQLESDVAGYAPDALVCVVSSADDWQPVVARLAGYRTMHLSEEQAESVFRVRGFPAVVSIEDGVVTRAGHELPVRV